MSAVFYLSGKQASAEEGRKEKQEVTVSQAATLEISMAALALAPVSVVEQFKKQNRKQRSTLQPSAPWPGQGLFKILFDDF